MFKTSNIKLKSSESDTYSEVNESFLDTRRFFLKKTNI